MLLYKHRFCFHPIFLKVLTVIEQVYTLEMGVFVHEYPYTDGVNKGPLNNLPRTDTARFHEWLHSIQSAYHSLTVQRGLSSRLLPGVVSGLRAVVPFVESHRLHLWRIGEWTIWTHGAGPLLTPPVWGYSYLYTNIPISS